MVTLTKNSNITYAELRCRSNFSFLRGASHPEEIIARAHTLKLSGIAIADYHGVYGLPKAHRAHQRLVNLEQSTLKFICAGELVLKEGFTVTLLASNHSAYQLMCQIFTRANEKWPFEIPSLDIATLVALAQQSPGRHSLFIGFEGCFNHSQITPQTSTIAPIYEVFQKNLFLFFCRYLDGLDKQRWQESLLIKQTYDLRVCATNHVLFHDSRRKPLHDILTATRLLKPMNQ